MVALMSVSCLGVALIGPHIAGLPDLVTAYVVLGYAPGLAVGWLCMRLTGQQQKT